MTRENPGKLPEFIKKNHSLIPFNRIKTGGHALFFSPVTNIKHLREVLILARENQLPFYILGKGSNVLISDDAFNGVVIKLEGNFKSISFDCDNKTVSAYAGASLMKLGLELAKAGYKGFSYMGVIPGTVGGAVRMNAGIKTGEEIKNNLTSSLVLDPENVSIIELKKEEMAFSYRESILLKSKKIIIKATFQLPSQKEKQKNEALNTVKELLGLRQAKHPKNPHTFGSTFKNPINSNYSAGWLLEKAGMKGIQIGGAKVAEEHANWIINTGNAKSSDVKQLIETGKKRVYEKFGVNLNREVIYLPEDMNEWSR